MNKNIILTAQVTGAVEYTDWISAEGKTPSNECSGYDIKQSDNKAPVLELCGVSLYCHRSQVHSDPEW